MSDPIEILKEKYAANDVYNFMLLAKAILHLADQLAELKERVDGIKAWMDGVQEPIIATDTAPQPDDEQHTCGECHSYDYGVCRVYSAKVSADAHPCRHFKAAPQPDREAHGPLGGREGCLPGGAVSPGGSA
jgi:hypothetical protein